MHLGVGDRRNADLSGSIPVNLKQLGARLLIVYHATPLVIIDTWRIANDIRWQGVVSNTGLDLFKLGTERAICIYLFGRNPYVVDSRPQNHVDFRIVIDFNGVLLAGIHHFSVDSAIMEVCQMIVIEINKRALNNVIIKNRLELVFRWALRVVVH